MIYRRKACHLDVEISRVTLFTLTHKHEICQTCLYPPSVTADERKRLKMPGEVSDEYNTHHQPHFGATRTEDKLALCTICLTGIIILQRIYLPQNKLVYGMITAS